MHFISTTSSPRDIKKVLNALTKAKVLLHAYKFPLGKEYSVDETGKIQTIKASLLHITIDESKRNVYEKIVAQLESYKRLEA